MGDDNVCLGDAKLSGERGWSGRGLKRSASTALGMLIDRGSPSRRSPSARYSATATTISACARAARTFSASSGGRCPDDAWPGIASYELDTGQAEFAYKRNDALAPVFMATDHHVRPSGGQQWRGNTTEPVPLELNDVRGRQRIPHPGEIGHIEPVSLYQLISNEVHALIDRLTSDWPDASNSVPSTCKTVQYLKRGDSGPRSKGREVTDIEDVHHLDGGRRPYVSPSQGQTCRSVR